VINKNNKIMKTLRNLALLSLVAFMFVGTGCKKYEEGPTISFRSKKARVVNDWHVKKEYKNGKDVTDDNLDLYYLFEDDNTGKITHIIHSGLGDITSNNNFKWDFNSDKTKLIITWLDDDGNPDGTEEYTILKLYENEMWWKYQNGDDTYEYHLEPK